MPFLAARQPGLIPAWDPAYFFNDHAGLYRQDRVWEIESYPNCFSDLWFQLSLLNEDTEYEPSLEKEVRESERKARIIYLVGGFRGVFVTPASEGFLLRTNDTMGTMLATHDDVEDCEAGNAPTNTSSVFCNYVVNHLTQIPSASVSKAEVIVIGELSLRKYFLIPDDVGSSPLRIYRVKDEYKNICRDIETSMSKASSPL